MENKEQAIEITQQEQNELLKIRRDKLKELQDNDCDPFKVTSFDVNIYAKQIIQDFDKLEGSIAAVAGRIMAKRDMGKAGFIDIMDASGRIQSYVRKDHVGDDSFKRFKKYDIGDIVGVKGVIFRTQKGEISIKADEVTLLSKSLLPLPEKWHGLKDQDMRYRQREVDLIVNPEVKDTFVKRSLILRALREFLDNRGFLEVDTPILTPLEIGASARPFYTHHNTLDMDMVLRIETELYLKRLIVGGFDKVYEVGRIFRNEGMDTKHNPEFTSIELYQAYTDYNGMMNLVEDMMKTVAQKVCGTMQIPYQGNIIDLSKWERMTMVEAVKKYSGVDFNEITSDEQAVEIAKQHKVELPEVPSKGAILAEFFDAFVEDKLIQPTFIYDYPVEISPLAKRKPNDPAFTERFEYFINATEFGNAFSELNDPIDQKARFEKQVADRKVLEPDTKAQVDYDYITALEYGLAPTGGLGFGLDRLVMLLTDSSSIRDVLLFPTMKPLDKKDTAAKQEKAVEKIDFSKVKIEPLFEGAVDFETFSKSDFRVVKIEACEAVEKSKKLLKFTLNDGTDRKRTILSGIREYYQPEELIGKTAVAIVNLPPRKMMGIESEGMLISAVCEYDGNENLNLLMLDDNIPAGAKLY